MQILETNTKCPIYRLKIQLENKIAECEELKNKERKLYKFLKESRNWGHNDVWIRNYLLHYLFGEREHTACTADILKNKLKALDDIEGMLQAIMETNKIYPLQSNLYKILDIISRAKGR